MRVNDKLLEGRVHRLLLVLYHRDPMVKFDKITQNIRDKNRAVSKGGCAKKEKQKFISRNRDGKLVTKGDEHDFRAKNGWLEIRKLRNKKVALPPSLALCAHTVPHNVGAACNRDRRTLPTTIPHPNGPCPL